MKIKFIFLTLFIITLFSCKKCNNDIYSKPVLMYVKDQGKTLVYLNSADFGKSSKELERSFYEYVSFGNGYSVTDKSNPDFYTILIEEKSYFIKPATLCYGFFTATDNIKANLQSKSQDVTGDNSYIDIEAGDFGFIIESDDNSDDILVDLKKYLDDKAVFEKCYIPKSAPYSSEIETGKAAYQLSKAFYRYYLQHNIKKAESELKKVYRFSIDESNPVYLRAKQFELLLKK